MCMGTRIAGYIYKNALTETMEVGHLSDCNKHQ